MKLPMFMVMFACNLAENGMFSGVCAGINVGVGKTTCALDLGGGEFNEEFECVGPKFEHTAVGVKLGEREFPSQGYQEWVGNWCWNAVMMRAADVADLVIHALSLKCFAIEGASGPLCDFDEKAMGRETLFKLLRQLQHEEAARA